MEKNRDKKAEGLRKMVRVEKYGMGMQFNLIPFNSSNIQTTHPGR